MRFYAAVVGPIACWLPLLIFYGNSSLSSGTWRRAIPSQIETAVGIIFVCSWLTYLPLSAAICGFSASYFLRSEYVGLPESAVIRVGFWTRYLFILIFCLHPCFLCCLAFLLIPLHVVIFDMAFARSVKFWKSNKPEEWLGEYEKPPELEE